MRPEWPNLNGEAHRDGRRVPSGCGKSFEGGLFGGGFVQMERLRIEFGREPLDVFPGDRNLTALETHSQRQVIEPLNHGALDSNPHCNGDMSDTRFAGQVRVRVNLIERL